MSAATSDAPVSGAPVSGSVFPTDPAEYVYVDTAFGGVDRRNNVRKLSDVRPPSRPVDCYMSWGRASSALQTWVATHKNAGGQPTVAGFDGAIWTPFLPLDFDHETDPRQALDWLRTVLRRLEAWGVDLRAVRAFFSGHKGFHLEVPHALFGEFTPATDLHARLKRAAVTILDDIPFDGSIYDRLRLWRIENTMHSKSRLYKIRLTTAEVLTLELPAILALAAHPRRRDELPELTPIDDNDWLPVVELAAIWAATDREPPSTPRVPAVVPLTDTARDRQVVAAIAASWPHGGTVRDAGGVRASRHTDYLLPLAGYLAARLPAERVEALLLGGAEAANDPSFLSAGRDWRTEIERLAASSAKRLASDDRVKGLPTLSQHFPAVASVLDALYPAPAPFRLSDADAKAPPRGTPSAPWPEPLAPEAFYGLPGEVVRALEPHTEADPAALVAHVLCGMGAYLGGDVAGVAGDATHPPKLNAVVVGRTAQGRKGTAQRGSERTVLLADPAFRTNITEGLSSGEGLIWQVRDPIYKWEKSKGGPAEEVMVDPGVEDKRLWVVESEFATVLRVAQREGNTLTAIVRRAWDRDDLRSLTKNSPARATGAHIAITGHVSRDELLRYLDRSELANGFANRFLFFAARRAQLLPEGGGVDEAALAPLAARLQAARAWARGGRRLSRDDEARALWAEAYSTLTRERYGMFGGATSRAEAQVFRLSILYAALDCSDVIRAEHLLAALAVWTYCEQSARWVFGDAVGDPTADTILAALRRTGELDREDIVNLFGRHAGRQKIDHALGTLLAAGLARMSKERTGGRPREVWHAA